MSLDDSMKQYLQLADEAERRGDAWRVVEGHLEEAERQANQDVGATGKVAGRRTVLRTRRQTRIDQLFAQLDEQLNATPLDVEHIRATMRDIATLALDINETQARLDRFESEKLKPKEEEAIADAHYQDLNHMADEAWRRGDDEFSTSAEQQKIVADYFEAPHRKIESIATRYPNYQPLQDLLHRAKDRLDKAKAQAIMPRTWDSLGKYQELLDFLVQQQADNPSYRPQIEDENGQLRPFTLPEAMLVVRKKIGNATRNRIMQPDVGYLDEAKKYLENHNPKAAEAKVQDGFKLPELDDDTRQALTRFLNDEVTPALNLYTNAERQADEAIRASQLANAYANLTKAKDIYPWAERVQEADRLIKQRAKDELSKILKQIREDYIEANALAEAQNKLAALESERLYSDILGRPTVDAQLEEAHALIRTIKEEQAAIGTVREEVSRLVNDNRDYPEADRVLSRFLSKYPTATRRDEVLERLAATIAVHVHMERLPATLENAYESNDLAQIQQAFTFAKEAEDSNNALAIKHNIPTLKRKLEGRMKVLGAEALLATPNKRDEARRTLESVSANSATPVDYERARALLKQLTDIITLERDLSTKLGDVELLLREDNEDYERAYDLLKPLMTDLPIEAELDRQRYQAWGQLIRGYAMQIEGKLRLMVSGNPPSNDLKLFEFLSMRREELGISQSDALAKDVKERIAALRGERFMEARQWGDAEENWNIALSYNQNNRDYRANYRLSRKNRFRSEINGLMTKDLSKAEALARDFAQEMADYLEPRVWVMDLLLVKAEDAETPEAFDDAWRQVDSILRDTTRMERSQDAALAELPEERNARQRIKDDITPKTDAGLENATFIKKIKRTVTSNQKLDTLHRAIHEMKAFLSNHRAYRGITRWWNGYLDDLISELENRALANRGDYWEAFMDFARLKIVDDAHEAATSHVDRMPQHMLELHMRTDELIGNYDRPPRTNQVTTDLIKDHIAEAQRVVDFINTAENSATFFKDVFGSKSLKKDIDALKEKREQLVVKIQAWGKIDSLYTEALQLAQTEGGRGKWERFDANLQALRNFDDGKYARHPAITALETRQKDIKDNRGNIQTQVQTLVELFEEQDIPALKEALAQLKKQDPNDIYGLQEVAQFKEPFVRNDFSGVDDLEGWLEDYDEQIGKLKAWLMPLLPDDELEALLRNDGNKSDAIYKHEKGVLARLSGLIGEADFVDWESYKAQKIRKQYLNSADFMRAMLEVRWALDGKDHEHLSERPTRLSLRKALDHIRSHTPYASRDLNSIHGRLLLKLGNEVTSLLERWIDDARDYQTEIEGIARDFFERLSAFDGAINAAVLHKRPADIEKAKDLHRQILEIAPDYRGIYPNISDYAVLVHKAGKGE